MIFVVSIFMKTEWWQNERCVIELNITGIGLIKKEKVLADLFNRPFR